MATDAPESESTSKEERKQDRSLEFLRSQSMPNESSSDPEVEHVSILPSRSPEFSEVSAHILPSHEHVSEVSVSAHVEVSVSAHILPSFHVSSSSHVSSPHVSSPSHSSLRRAHFSLPDEESPTGESLPPEQAVYLAEQLGVNPVTAVIDQYRRDGGYNTQLNRVLSDMKRNPHQSPDKSQPSATSKTSVQDIEVERLQEEIKRLQNMLGGMDKLHQHVGVQFNYLVPMSAHLRGVHVVGEKLFVISGEFPQLLEWEEYGLRIQVPEGATSEPCDIAIKAIVAGQFEFPEGTDLISAVYAISVSKRLAKPVMLEIQHCVAITREEQGRFLSFVRAQCNQPQLPYQFELLDNGTFPPHSDYGKIACDRFSCIAIGRSHNPLTDSHASPIKEEYEQVSSAPLLASTENSSSSSTVHGCKDDVQASPSHSEQENVAASVEIKESERETTSNEATQQLQLLPTLSAAVEPNQSTTDTNGEDPPMKYSLYVFYINKARNSWVWHFNVTKDLNALIQYVQQSHPNWQNGIHLPFQYFKTEVLLELEAEYCYKGWWIMPSQYPCKFRKHLVDDWNHSIPYCRKVKVCAQEGPDTAPFINYPVFVKGTTEDGMRVVIQEQLQTSDPVILPAAQAPPDHDRSTAHLALQKPPTIPDLLNKVAAEASDKWKKLGQQLLIEQHKLKTISRENDDSLDCFAEVFELWQKRGSPPYTWATIIDALRAKIVGEVQLAYELEQWVMST